LVFGLLTSIYGGYENSHTDLKALLLRLEFIKAIPNLQCKEGFAFELEHYFAPNSALHLSKVLGTLSRQRQFSLWSNFGGWYQKSLTLASTHTIMEGIEFLR
jgi:hypothetical protein